MPRISRRTATRRRRLPWLRRHRRRMLDWAFALYCQGQVPATYVKARAEKCKSAGALKRQLKGGNNSWVSSILSK